MSGGSRFRDAFTGDSETIKSHDRPYVLREITRCIPRSFTCSGTPPLSPYPLFAPSPIRITGFFSSRPVCERTRLWHWEGERLRFEKTANREESSRARSKYATNRDQRNGTLKPASLMSTARVFHGKSRPRFHPRRQQKRKSRRSLKCFRDNSRRH